MKQWLLAVVGAVLLVSALSVAHAQGCSQCREAVGQTPARTQTAYRRGILVLVLAGAGVFTGTLLLLRNYRSR